jgi:hypothetical protein
MTGRRRDDGLAALVTGVAAAVSWWRLELAVLALAAGTCWLLARTVGDVLAAVAVLVLVAALLAAAPVRGVLWRATRRAWVLRAWARATVDVGLADGPLRVPRVLGATRIPAGELLRVRVRRGQSVGALAARADELGACLRVRELRVESDPADAAIARVTLVRRDPFADSGVLAWPALDAQSLSMWEPVPIGVDELGEPVAMRLIERNVLIGGEPGAGKSVTLSVLVAAGALDAQTRVWLLDGKLVELACWAPIAERVVGPDGEQALELLRELQREMDARYRELLARGLRKLRREDELALHLGWRLGWKPGWKPQTSLNRSAQTGGRAPTWRPREPSAATVDRAARRRGPDKEEVPGSSPPSPTREGPACGAFVVPEAKTRLGRWLSERRYLPLDLAVTAPIEERPACRRWSSTA